MVGITCVFVNLGDMISEIRFQFQFQRYDREAATPNCLVIRLQFKTIYISCNLTEKEY